MKIRFVTTVIIFFVQSITLTTLSHGMYDQVRDPFFYSISRGNNAYFDQLLETEKGKPNRLNEALIRAARDGRPKMVTKLLAAGANINYEKCGSTPLVYAIITQRKDMIRQLRGQGAQEITELQRQGLSPYFLKWYDKVNTR